MMEIEIELNKVVLKGKKLINLLILKKMNKRIIQVKEFLLKPVI